MVVILGCGYTGRRVARRLIAKGLDVTVTTRNPEALSLPRARVLPLSTDDSISLDALSRAIEPGARVLHSVPLVNDASRWSDPTPQLLAALPPSIARVVYLSTTGVYGAQVDVDEHTQARPRTPRETLRAEAERHVMAGPWSSTILRPAAIYGPGRGIHVSMRRGDFLLLGDGSNYVSRIHVDDLAALAEAALLSDLSGAWPVADLEPARSRDIAAWCAELLQVPMPREAPVEELSETRRANRRVDGRAVCERLGVALRYESYRTGIPAAIAEESESGFALQSNP